MDQIPSAKRLLYKTHTFTPCGRSYRVNEHLEEKRKYIKNFEASYKEKFAELVDRFKKQVSDEKTIVVMQGWLDNKDASIAYDDFKDALQEKGYKVDEKYDPDDDMDYGFHFCRPSYTLTIT